jgi:predicted oxidoreductase (fatty acid repression mutant protein)
MQFIHPHIVNDILQHSGGMVEEIAEKVRKQWNLPSTWRSTAMMPFGIPTGAPGVASRPKTFQPLEERFKVFEK